MAARISRPRHRPGRRRCRRARHARCAACACTAGGSDKAGGGPSSNEIVASIEALAGLHQRGILSDEEFATKKAELLARL